jgi:hypothetical protein
MRYLSNIVFLLVVLAFASVLGALLPVSAADSDIKIRDGTTEAGNIGVDGDGTSNHPTFTEGHNFELLHLPAGFNFSDPDLNIAHEKFGNMTSFSGSELPKIPGYILTADPPTTVTIWCQGGKAPVSDIKKIVEGLIGLGPDHWCCRTTANFCTEMWSHGEATSCISAPKTKKENPVDCLRCTQVAEYIAAVNIWCQNYSTKQAAGLVRYVSLSVTGSNTDPPLQSHRASPQEVHVQHRCLRSAQSFFFNEPDSEPSDFPGQWFRELSKHVT